MISEIKKIFNFLFFHQKPKLISTIFYQFFSSILDLLVISFIMPYILIFSNPDRVFNNHWINKFILFFDFTDNSFKIFASISLVVLLCFSTFFGIIGNAKLLKYSYEFHNNYLVFKIR